MEMVAYFLPENGRLYFQVDRNTKLQRPKVTNPARKAIVPSLERFIGELSYTEQMNIALYENTV